MYSSIVNPRLDMLGLVVIVLSLIAFLLAIMVKAMIKPFDIPEAETELAGGLLAELSGPTLALAIILHYSEIAFLTLIATLLFLGGPYPLSYGDYLGSLVITVKYLVMLFIITLIRASVGRIRIEQAASIVVKYMLTVSVVALIIASLA